MNFSKSVALKSKLKFATHFRRHRGGFGGLSPSETKVQAPPNLNMKHYKTVMFVQISECQAPLHKCKSPLTYWRLYGDGSVGTPSFSSAFPLVRMVRFQHRPLVHIHNFIY